MAQLLPKLKKRLWRGSVALLFLILVYSALKQALFPPISSLYNLLSLGIQKIAAFPEALIVLGTTILMIIVPLGLVYVLGLLSEKTRPAKPTLKLIFRKVPILDIVRKIQENPERFHEVMFELYPGIWKKGILIDKKNYPFPNPNSPQNRVHVFEPRPLSPGGEIYYVDENKVFKTGRNGGATIQEITLGYGSITPET